MRVRLLLFRESGPEENRPQCSARTSGLSAVGQCHVNGGHTYDEDLVCGPANGDVCGVSDVRVCATVVGRRLRGRNRRRR